MRLVRLLPLAAAPALAATFVMSGFVSNGMLTTALVRPLFVAVAISALLLVAFVAVLGRERGAFWGFVATSVVAGMFVVGGASVLALAVLGWLRRRRRDQYRMAGMVATGVAVSLLAILTARAAADGALDSSPLATSRIDIPAGDGGPSMNIMLLDGYPRADVLASMGFDNSSFLGAMQARGFDVYADSQSNYDRTPFSILSILSGAHIADIDALWEEPVPAGEPDQQRRVARALLDPPIFDALDRLGYRTRALTATVVHAPIGGADEIWNAGTASNFELVLLQRTPLAAPLEWFGFATGQQRAHIRETLAAFAEAPPGPTFTFAHVMSPHAPLVFEADGSPAQAPSCYPAVCAIFDGDPANLGMTDEEYAERFVDQVAHLNELVQAAVDNLIARDPDAVIMLLSDHGIEGDEEVVHHRNLLLARTPGHPGLLGRSPTTVNVVPMLMNAYLGASMPLQPDTLYRSGGSPWLAVEPIGKAGP